MIDRPADLYRRQAFWCPVNHRRRLQHRQHATRHTGHRRLRRAGRAAPRQPDGGLHPRALREARDRRPTWLARLGITRYRGVLHRRQHHELCLGCERQELTGRLGAGRDTPLEGWRSGLDRGRDGERWCARLDRRHRVAAKRRELSGLGGVSGRRRASTAASSRSRSSANIATRDSGLPLPTSAPPDPSADQWFAFPPQRARSLAVRRRAGWRG